MTIILKNWFLLNQVLLHGEYMGKDGRPYCERDYQREFGVKCTYCRRFISGKVLQVRQDS